LRKTFLLVVGAIIVVLASAQLDSLTDLKDRLPSAFKNTFLHIEAWQWVGLGLVLVTCSIAGYVVRSLFKRVTFLRDRFAAQAMSNETRATVSLAAGILAATSLAQALVQDLELGDKFLNDVMLLIEGIAIFAAVLLVYGWWDAVCDSIAAKAAGHQRAERLLIPVTRKLVRALIVIVGILIALAEFYGPKTLAGLAAGLGLGGVVLALAAKDSVENVFASVTILFDMPFALGDWIVMDKVEGSVEEINLRSTRIRTATDTLITLPNANLIRAPVENFGARRRRRQRLNIRLSYNSPAEGIDRFCDGLREYIAKQPKLVKGLTSVQLDDPHEFTLGVVVMWFLDTNKVEDEAKSRHAVLEEALRLKSQYSVIFATPGEVSGLS